MYGENIQVRKGNNQIVRRLYEYLNQICINLSLQFVDPTLHNI